MERCLICLEKLESPPGWFSFFLPHLKNDVCDECAGKFEKIEGAVCKVCCRPLHTAEADDKCYDCIRWEEGPFGGVLSYNRSVYVYNSWMKDVLARFKFRGDAALAAVFARDLRMVYRQHFFHYIVVPVPLSPERMRERGFNQAELLASSLSEHLSHPLARVHAKKQSKKTRAERVKGESPFFITANERLEGKRIVLIDDVYTTGTTIRQCAALLLEQGAVTVSSLTLCRG